MEKFQILFALQQDEISWIQWYGGTETAYQDHLDYKNGEDNYGYDEYCQGLHCGIDFGAEWSTQYMQECMEALSTLAMALGVLWFLLKLVTINSNSTSIEY